MTSRERVIAVTERRPVDRTPVDLWHTPEVYAALSAHFKTTSAIELYKALGLDKIVYSMIEYRHAPGAPPMSSYGVPLRTCNTGVAVYDEYGDPPLANYDTPESLDDYPLWPDVDRFDYDRVLATMREAHPHFVTNAPWVSFFEIYCQLRGMETAMMDLLAMPELANAILDRIEDIQTRMMRRLFTEGKGYIDWTFISDDMGSQNGLLISLDLWDYYFQERLKRFCTLVHSFGQKVFFHTDGAAEELIPRLIDAGVDILNPIQHNCPGMDCEGLKRKYGNKLIFHGGIDTQQALPFGTPDEVRAETRHCLRTLGAGGGYVCASCHNLQPGTPIENILAFIETVHKEGAV